MVKFKCSDVVVKPPLFSDHCSILLNTDIQLKSLPKPFKFFRFWSEHPDYRDIVKRCWSTDVSGNSLLNKISGKLRVLKEDLKKLNRERYSDIRERVKVAELNLTSAQSCYLDSANQGDFERVQRYHSTWQDLLKAEEIFLKQKACNRWVNCGDQNSSYFHRSLVVRRSFNTITRLIADDGTVLEDSEGIGKEAVKFYTSLLGTPDTNFMRQSADYYSELLLNKLSAIDCEALIETVSDKEVRDALFSIGDDKSPGPDGYSAFFFKDSWDIIGNEITAAIREFFVTGELSPGLNSTIIALIPKVPNADRMKLFRPISCCNVLYKCITKIMATRLSSILPRLISRSQSAFIKGRLISDNILLAHDLVSAYHKAQTSPICVLKVDIMKAFDSVDWTFILTVLEGMNFPLQFIDWIRKCLTSSRFSVCVNGASVGYFAGMKGLRQGDPLSPLLFVISMEVLHCLLNRVAKLNLYPFHPRCKKLGITHLCFADDLLIFANGSMDGIKKISAILKSFYLLSGLKINPGKTDLFCSSSVSPLVRSSILSQMGFNIGELPVRYLGVPLISGKLLRADCQVLIDRIVARISSWTAKSLSYAGRLQLVKSVLLSISHYWMNIFLLPGTVTKEIEKICNKFLWNVDGVSRKKVKCSWAREAIPYEEGGLDLPNLSLWNTACIARHLWAIVMRGESLWIAWIHTYRIQKRDIWSCVPSTNASWVWKRILKARESIFPHFTFDLEGELLWDGLPAAKFKVSKILLTIRPKSDHVSWFELVWKRPGIPSHCFITWMVMLKVITTMDKLSKWGLVIDDTCRLCKCAQEDFEHIFVDCAFSRVVLLKFFEKFHPDITAVSTTWSDLANWASSFVGGSGREVAGRLLWRAYCSSVWKERCARTYGARMKSEGDLVSSVKMSLSHLAFQKNSRDIASYI
ncbi:LINE-1 retrotransposable element ORF2 protein [Linum perenne]